MTAVLESRALESRFPRLVATPSDYWHQSRRPLASLLFVLPLLLAYEAGFLFFGPDAVRNGADVWLQGLLGALGFGGFLLLPLLTVAILVGLHHISRQPWRVSPSVLYTMAAECTLFAMLLVVIARLHVTALAVNGPSFPSDLSIETSITQGCSRVVRYFGAGVYEELLFRLMLVPATMYVIGLAVASRGTKIALALALTSLAFSAAHYIGPHGEDFLLYTFVFRYVAGAFFAMLFVFRGFGIAVGTHALYDIFVG